MIWYVIGGVLIALGIGLVIFYKSQGDKLFLLKATETSLVSNIEQEAKDVTEGMGEKGSFNKFTEVKGKVTCPSPLTSELANAKCVYYSMSITRRWEEEYWETDSEGRRERRTRTGTDTVASNTRHVPFFVQDETGKIKINPEGAEFVSEKSYSNFQPGEISGSSISIGNFRLNLSGLGMAGGRRTIGYNYEESIVPVDRDVFIIGEVADSGGALQFQRPTEKGKKFIISTKSEEELQRSIAGGMTATLIGSIVSGVGGIVLIALKILGVIGNQ
jgi:hypothetical protein